MSADGLTQEQRFSEPQAQGSVGLGLPMHMLACFDIDHL